MPFVTSAPQLGRPPVETVRQRVREQEAEALAESGPWTPPVPIVGVDERIRRIKGGFVIDGVAIVLAGMYRSDLDAFAIARRIAADAEAYLDVATRCRVMGIQDLR